MLEEESGCRTVHVFDCLKTCSRELPKFWRLFLCTDAAQIRVCVCEGEEGKSSAQVKNGGRPGGRSSDRVVG